MPVILGSGNGKRFTSPEGKASGKIETPCRSAAVRTLFSAWLAFGSMAAIASASVLRIGDERTIGISLNSIDAISHHHNSFASLGAFLLQLLHGVLERVIKMRFTGTLRPLLNRIRYFRSIACKT